MDINKAQSWVLEAGIKLVESGLIARTWGNISCRVDEESFLITPSGRSYSSLTAKDLVQVKSKDLSYQGEIKPSSEKGVHAAVYELYPDINFVIHTHQDNASVIAATGLKRVKIGDQYPTLGDEVICAEYALLGTKALCKKVRKALGDTKGKALIMKHHGVLCFGRDVEDTFTAAYELEQACADFVVNRYLMLSQETEYNPLAMCAFALGKNSLTELSFFEQSQRSYGDSHRSNQGFIWYDGIKEAEIRDQQDLNGLPEEITTYRAIYRKHKGINQIIYKATPEILGVSAAGLTLKPLLDDFAQLIGLQVKTVDEHDPELIAGALSKSAAVFIRNGGALCCGRTKEDAVAVGMILQKACKALIGASLFGKVKPINPFESMLMRYVYLKKYSKQAERNVVTVSRR